QSFEIGIFRVSVEVKSIRSSETSINSGERAQGSLGYSWGQIGVVRQSANSVLIDELPDPWGLYRVR
ncbi:MAG: hypothetical protein AAGE59_33370, partial [Cyanobacteria bacterium P01_F01_bin.86]